LFKNQQKKWNKSIQLMNSRKLIKIIRRNIYRMKFKSKINHLKMKTEKWSMLNRQ
jgi:hypothetical protein